MREKGRHYASLFIGCRLLDLALQPGARGGHGSRALEAGTGAAGCRSWPASWGDHGRWARGALVLDGQQPVAGMGGAGCRSWPASRGDHGRGPSAATVPERWRRVWVGQGAGAGPPAGVIMAGGSGALTGLLRRLQEWVLIWGETQGLIP